MPDDRLRLRRNRRHVAAWLFVELRYDHSTVELSRSERTLQVVALGGRNGERTASQAAGALRALGHLAEHGWERKSSERVAVEPLSQHQCSVGGTRVRVALDGRYG